MLKSNKENHTSEDISCIQIFEKQVFSNFKDVHIKKLTMFPKSVLLSLKFSIENRIEKSVLGCMSTITSLIQIMLLIPKGDWSYVCLNIQYILTAQLDNKYETCQFPLFDNK